MARRTRHPSYLLTDEEYDRFDADGINDPPPRHAPEPDGEWSLDPLRALVAEVEVARDANERTSA